MKPFLSILYLLFISVFSYTQITILPPEPIANYAQHLVGPGVTISNIQFTGSLEQISKFTSTGLGINQGVVLCTGQTNMVIGPDNNNGATANPTTGRVNGDPQLQAIAGANVFDVAILEFDIVPYGDSLNFSFIFGSEEYLEYVNAGFNDAFAFFITDPNNVTTNVALVPGTTTPVSIDNVNNNVNAAYYINNGGTITQLDGRTTRIDQTVQVICGGNYHFKIAIADAGDGILESAVFIEAGSFTSSNTFTPPSLTASRTDICAGDTVQLFANDNGNTSVMYTPGFSSGTSTLTPTDTTTYMAITNIVNCPVSDTQQVIVNVIPNPIASFSSANYCEGDITTLINTSANYDSVIWTVDGNTFTNTDTVNYTFPSSGTYTITLEVFNNGCSHVTQEGIQIQARPTPSFTLPSICQFESGTFVNTTTTAGSPYTPTYQFTWDLGNGSLSTASNATGTYDTAQIYTIQLQAINDAGCVGDTSIDIQIHAKPIASYFVDSVCFGLPTSFTDQSIVANGSISSWNWNINGQFANSSNVTFTFNSDGSFPSSLIVTSNMGCKDTATANVTVFPLPIADFTSSRTKINALENEVFFTNTSQGASFYYWDFANAGTSTITNPSFVYTIQTPCEEFTNQLIAETSQGCRDTVYHTVLDTGLFSMFVPSAFTPNNDGKNEVLLPILSDASPNGYLFQVFNRWGDLIYQTDLITNGWDGLYKGEYNQEVYNYRIEARSICTNVKRQAKGHFNLLR